MTAIPLPCADRFEALATRFFDGLLSDDEDQEFAHMLAAEPLLAHRFRQWVRVERSLASMHDEPVELEAFVFSVVRGAQMAGNPLEVDCFTDSVMELVRKPGSALSQRRARVSRRMEAAEARNSAGIGIGIAAGLTFALLLILTVPSSNTRRADAPVPDPEPAYQPPATPRPNSTGRTALKPTGPQEPAALAPTDTNTSAYVPEQPSSATMPAPVEAERTHEDTTIQHPAPEPQVAQQTPAVQGLKIAIGTLEQVSGVKAVWMEQGGAERSAAGGDEIPAGSILKILPLETDQALAMATLKLATGFRMNARPGARISFAIADETSLPSILAGEVAFAPIEAGGGNLRIHCAEGPEVALQNTTATVLVSEADRQTKVSVTLGRAVVSAFGVSRYVFTRQECITRNGRAPSFPYTIVPPAPVSSGSQRGSSGGTENTGASTGPDTSGDSTDGKPDDTPGKGSGASSNGNGNSAGASGTKGSNAGGNSGGNAGGKPATNPPGTGNSGGSGGNAGGTKAGGAPASGGKPANTGNKGNAGGTGGSAGGAGGGNAGGSGGSNAGGNGGAPKGPKLGL